MDITTFLAQLWGPVLLAVGAGFFTSASYYNKLYRELERHSLALLTFALAGIAAGVAQIQAHNAWDSLPEIIVSFLGWGLLAKGILLAVAPRFVDKAGDWTADSKLVSVAGAVMLVIGAYLSWFAYF